MLSDPNYDYLPLDIPDLAPGENSPAPLDFDDLLDIAREFEFTRMITHIWPSDDPSTRSQTDLDDLLTAINTEENPLPLPISALDSVHVHDLNSHPPTSAYTVPDANASTSPIPLSSDDGPLRAGVQHPTATLVQGWSPPNGSQFLDIDDNLMLPQSTETMWIPPWLATFVTSPYAQPVYGQLPATVPEISAIQPATLAKGSISPSATTIEKTIDDPRKEGMPFVPLPLQPSIPASLEPIRPRSTLQTKLNVPNYVATPKSRPQIPSAPTMSATPTAQHARAPRGGIPPHVARTVTKANILRVEKERKVIRDTFSTTTTGQGKKPSVLRRAAKVDREANKIAGCGSRGKKVFASYEVDEKDARAAKRKKV